MRNFKYLLLFTALLPPLASCNSEEATSKADSCRERFGSEALSNWAARLDRLQDGEKSVSYTVQLPIDDAKKIENAIAQMPGDMQSIQFTGDGSAQVTISGAQVPVSIAVSTTADDDDTSTAETFKTNHPIIDELCSASGTVGGTLLNVSIQSNGYRFDDGKVYSLPVP